MGVSYAMNTELVLPWYCQYTKHIMQTPYNFWHHITSLLHDSRYYGNDIPIGKKEH